MAREEELVDRVKSAPNVLRVSFLEEHPSHDGGVDRFYAVLVKTAENVVQYETFCIRVYNRGAENEKAYFRDSVPTPLMQPPSRFPDELKEYMKEIRKGQQDIIKFSVETMDVENEFAVVTAWVAASEGKASRRKYFVYKDKDGKFKHRELVE